MAEVCERCGFPAIEVAGNWQHASVADAAFCAIVFEVVDSLVALMFLNNMDVLTEEASEDA